MGKEKLLSLLKIKDYSKELEQILVNKPFSQDAQNLLLNMLYKIENSYEDYKKVKIEVPSKNDFMEELLRIIENDCKEIEFLKPDEQSNTLAQGEISAKAKKIFTYQNELSILKALLKLDSDKYKLSYAYDIEPNMISELLNQGRIEQYSEVIRDFDGWSWNTMTSEIDEFDSNLVYQGLVYLIGYEKLEQNKIGSIDEILKENYKQSFVTKICNAISKIAIIKNINEEPETKEALQNKCKQYKKELELIQDKKEYINYITEEKKKRVKQIETIDKYLSNDLELKKEYIRQNQKLSSQDRDLSLNDFIERVQKERKKLARQIELLTQRLKPQNYLKDKNITENKLEILEDINIEEPDIKKHITEFVKALLKGISTKINGMTTKKEFLDAICILRYLNFFYINERTMLKDKYESSLQKTEKELITKGCNLKVLSIFSEDVNENFDICKYIFETKIIDLESVSIEVDNDNLIKIYDENSLEKTEKCNEFKSLIVKYKKKTKILL